MALNKRTIRASPATTTTTTSVTNAQLKALIDKGVADALAARDADKSMNGNDTIICALTWWNSYVTTVGHDVVYAMTWTNLKKKMTDKYCPRGEIKKLEIENKRKQDDNNNQAQQQPPKKQGVAITYTAGPGKRKESPAATNNQRNLTCYECRNQGHYISDCLKLKNQNHGNQAEGTRACGTVHALGGGETNQDLNDIEDDINA
nr:reverse transcriptase domain-containing protein [Tanacetum cinerariifolium]